jgi:hypothetical protein
MRDVSLKISNCPSNCSFVFTSGAVVRLTGTGLGQARLTGNQFLTEALLLIRLQPLDGLLSIVGAIRRKLRYGVGCQIVLLKQHCEPRYNHKLVDKGLNCTLGLGLHSHALFRDSALSCLLSIIGEHRYKLNRRSAMLIT